MGVMGRWRRVGERRAAAEERAPQPDEDEDEDDDEADAENESRESARQRRNIEKYETTVFVH